MNRNGKLIRTSDKNELLISRGLKFLKSYTISKYALHYDIVGILTHISMLDK